MCTSTCETLERFLKTTTGVSGPSQRRLGEGVELLEDVVSMVDRDATSPETPLAQVKVLRLV